MSIRTTLNDSIAAIRTAIGNDYSFAELFARQVKAFGAPGDLLVALSTSGKSENIKRELVEPDLAKE